MIVVYNDIMTNKDSDEFIEYYKNNVEKEYVETDNIYRYKAVTITREYNQFSFLRRIGLTPDMMDRVRIQCVDDTIKTVENPHSHLEPYSFVCFLNEDFEGGELVFNNITFHPKRNQVIYFTKDERHLVKNVSNGYRYTLVCFLKKDLFNIIKVDKLI